ncbi:girdin-like [Clytia hemisphaerica]|uniref:Girdin protein n=1 Tax=Clytia hemisphaerica TaxID=252671 RepID=A0A7M6DRG9_9CNID
MEQQKVLTVLYKNDDVASSVPDPIKLQKECNQLRHKLENQEALKKDLENIKQELEKVLETHKMLQKVAIALEEKNRTLLDQYKLEAREKMTLEEKCLDLENEIETKKMSYDGLEKRFQKMKEKMSASESLEDMVYTLEKDKRKANDKVQELKDEIETLQQGSGNKFKDFEDKISKLTKENKDLSVKLETYLEEMEDMEQKNDALEADHKKLTTDYEHLKSIELVGTNMIEITQLEQDKSELKSKLRKEIEKRETCENELFRVEEEYETFKMELEESELKLESEISKVNIDLFGRKASTASSISLDNDNNNNLTDSGMKFLIRKKQKLMDNLEKENDDLKKKVQQLEQEHEILLEENSNIAKSNIELEDQLQKCETTITDLEEKSREAESERKRAEQESFSRLMTSAEKELEHNERAGEIDRLKREVVEVQDILRITAIERNELQAELFHRMGSPNHQSSFGYSPNSHTPTRQMERSYSSNQMDRSYSSTQMDRGYSANQMERSYSSASQLITDNHTETSSTSSFNSQESEQVLNAFHRKALRYDEEKEREYESKIQHQNEVIKSLEDRIHKLREHDQYNMNNNNSKGEISSPETTPPVAIKNGRLHDSMDDFADNTLTRRQRSKSLDCLNRSSSEEALEHQREDTLDDRELRRISYQLADGNWKHLPNDLNIKKRQEINQIINSSYKDQEKIYRMLVVWRAEMEKKSREDLLRYLIDHLGNRRKDIVKFLKDMTSSKHVKDNQSIKTRFQKFTRSVRR